MKTQFFVTVEYSFEFADIEKNFSDEAAELETAENLDRDDALRQAFQERLERDSSWLGCYDSEKILDVRLGDK